MISNGPIRVPQPSCRWYRIGPLEYLSQATDGVEWAHWSYREIWPIMSNGPIQTTKAHCQLCRMGLRSRGRPFHLLHGNGCPRCLWHSNSVLSPQARLVLLHCGGQGQHLTTNGARADNDSVATTCESDARSIRQKPQEMPFTTRSASHPNPCNHSYSFWFFHFQYLRSSIYGTTV
jgi:hypothetical protein